MLLNKIIGTQISYSHLSNTNCPSKTTNKRTITDIKRNSWFFRTYDLRDGIINQFRVSEYKTYMTHEILPAKRVVVATLKGTERLRVETSSSKSESTL